MKTGFATLHPMVQAVFFLSCLSVTTWIMHPVILVISFAAGLVCIAETEGKSGLWSSVRTGAGLSCFAAILNPLFSHGGVTVWGYLPDGNPLTMESLIFGAAAGLLLFATLNWFRLLSKIMTSDKMIYLFGRLFPRFALLLSMVFSFFGKIRQHYQEVRAARQSLLPGMRPLSWIVRIRFSAGMLSSLIQWSLENALDTADSMNSRGYGSGKRTFFHLYHLHTEDIVWMLILIAGNGWIWYAFCNEQIAYSYYPAVSMEPASVQALSVFVLFGVLCLLPVVADGKEYWKWRCLRSKI